MAQAVCSPQLPRHQHKADRGAVDVAGVSKFAKELLRRGSTASCARN